MVTRNFTAPRLTIEDWIAIPEGEPMYEFWHGDPYLVPKPNIHHQGILMALVGTFGRKRGEAFMLPYPAYLDQYTVVLPDYAYAAETNPGRRKQGFHGTPDVIAEILIPQTARRDLGAKRALYHEFRVPELWFIDPMERRVIVDREVDGEPRREEVLSGKQELTTPLIPDAAISLTSLWKA